MQHAQSPLYIFDLGYRSFLRRVSVLDLQNRQESVVLCIMVTMTLYDLILMKLRQWSFFVFDVRPLFGKIRWYPSDLANCQLTGHSIEFPWWIWSWPVFLLRECSHDEFLVLSTGLTSLSMSDLFSWIQRALLSKRITRQDTDWSS